jgi:hypothetical protein
MFCFFVKNYFYFSATEYHHQQQQQQNVMYTTDMYHYNNNNENNNNNKQVGYLDFLAIHFICLISFLQFAQHGGNTIVAQQQQQYRTLDGGQ